MARRQHRWAALAARVRHSLVTLFWQPSLGCLSDCLHAAPGQPGQLVRAGGPTVAGRVRPVDALRLGGRGPDLAPGHSLQGHGQGLAQLFGVGATDHRQHHAGRREQGRVQTLQPGWTWRFGAFLGMARHAIGVSRQEARHRRVHEGGIGDRRQVDVINRDAGVVGKLSRQFGCQPGLPDATGASALIEAGPPQSPSASATSVVGPDPKCRTRIGSNLRSCPDDPAASATAAAATRVGS